MKSKHTHDRGNNGDNRIKRSKARTRRLLTFPQVLNEVRLAPREQARYRTRQFLFAAELCAPRGEYRVTKKLLTRAYRLAARYELSSECAEAAKQRYHVETVLHDTRAMRLWSRRMVWWQDRTHQLDELQQMHRAQYYQEVLCLNADMRPHEFNEQFLCPELEHIVLPYQMCAEKRYQNALDALADHTITNSQHVILQDECTWLRFRIHCSMGSFHEALSELESLSQTRITTRRISEYVRLGKAYLELHDILCSEPLSTHRFSIRRTTFVNSFSYVLKETGGMMIALCVYELCRTLLEGDFNLADQRLAALRVRLVRRTNGNDLDELRVFLRIINHIIATQHRMRKVQPQKLLNLLLQRTPHIRYTLQGIVPYDFLAVLLLRYMGYK